MAPSRPATRSRRPVRVWSAWAVTGALLVSLLVPVARGAHATAAWEAAPVPLPGPSVVLQVAEVDCGPALVATLAAWAGRPVGLDAVTAQATLRPEGVSLGEFARLSSLHGLEGAWFAVPGARLASLRAPFVAHLERGGAGHFVAVVALDGHHAVIADPAAGALAGPARALLRDYSGRAFLLHQPPAPVEAGS